MNPIALLIVVMIPLFGGVLIAVHVVALMPHIFKGIQRRKRPQSCNQSAKHHGHAVKPE